MPPVATQTERANQTALAATDLVKVFGSGNAAVRALDGVTARFDRGSFTAIMGASGSGKSTLLHLLAGLDTPTSGRVLVGDTDITGLADRPLSAIRRDRIGFVFQSFNLLPTLTARQNILLPADLAGRKVERARLDGLAASLGIVDRLAHRPSELSGGEQQRVAIARALVTAPDVVVADEPTGQLDSGTGHELLDYLRSSAREFGQTIVMVTHDPIAASYAEKVMLLADGSVRGEVTDPRTETVLTALASLEGDRR